MSRLARAVLSCALLGVSACTPRLADPDLEPGRLAETREAWIDEAVEDMLADSSRVATIGNRLRVAGTPVCADAVAPLLGFYAARRFPGRVSLPFIEALYQRYDVTKTLTVTLVAPNSPAARAGLVGGERVLRIHGRRVRRAEKIFEAAARAPQTPPVLLIERDGASASVTLALEPACGFVVYMLPSDVLATGRAEHGHAAIGRGLVDFARNDDELAILIAHELGHRVLGGRHPSYPENELEADRLGIEITRLAGFDAGKAPGLYERLALEKPWLVVHDPERLDSKVEEPIHGRLAQRILALRTLLAD